MSKTEKIKLIIKDVKAVDDHQAELAALVASSMQAGYELGKLASASSQIAS